MNHTLPPNELTVFTLIKAAASICFGMTAEEASNRGRRLFFIGTIAVMKEDRSINFKNVF